MDIFLQHLQPCTFSSHLQPCPKDDALIEPKVEYVKLMGEGNQINYVKIIIFIVMLQLQDLARFLEKKAQYLYFLKMLFLVEDDCPSPMHITQFVLNFLLHVHSYPLEPWIYTKYLQKKTGLQLPQLKPQLQQRGSYFPRPLAVSSSQCASFLSIGIQVDVVPMFMMI